MTYTAQALRPRRAATTVEADIDARVAKHMPLVRRLAWHVHGRVSSACDLEDILQVGMVALVEAAAGFEDRGFEFSTYASIRIKGAMIDHLRKGMGTSRSSGATRRAIGGARKRIEDRECRAASAAEVAAELGIADDAYFRLEQQVTVGSQVPLDAVYADDDIGFSDQSLSPEEQLIGQQNVSALSRAIAQLGHREQLVLQLYFFEELNLDEIGRVLGVSAARVCQLKAKALATVSSYFGSV